MLSHGLDGIALVVDLEDAHPATLAVDDAHAADDAGHQRGAGVDHEVDALSVDELHHRRHGLRGRRALLLRTGGHGPGFGLRLHLYLRLRRPDR